MEDLRISFYPNKKCIIVTKEGRWDTFPATIQVLYKQDHYMQWITFAVDFQVVGNFPNHGQIDVEVKARDGYVADGRRYGLTPPDFSAQDLKAYLPIDNKRYWYYCNNSFGSGIHHISDITTLPKSRNVHYYEIEQAIQCGFLRLDKGKRMPSKDEIFRRLTRSGCICSDSPLSATPIRVAYKGDVEAKIKSLVNNPYMMNFGLEGDLQRVDLWEWGLELDKDA